MQRAGLRVGPPRYFAYSVAIAIGFAILFLAALPLEPFTRPRSPQRPFVGLGLSGLSVAMAVLYGAIKTGFAEEFLFRGPVADGLGRPCRCPGPTCS